jgi:hypothetical protein
MSELSPVEIDAATGQVESIPPEKNKRYRCKLDTLAEIKSEMAKLYREARSGMIDTVDCTKLTYVLQQIAKITVDGDIEQRLEKLEETHEFKKQS